MSRYSFSFFLLLMGLSVTVCYAEQPLRHDPFARPEIEISAPAAANQTKSEVLPDRWTARLRATLQAGEQSIANVDGNIITLGESYQGYRLVRVLERSAVFIRKGKRYTLHLDTQDEEDEPQLSAIQ